MNTGKRNPGKTKAVKAKVRVVRGQFLSVVNVRAGEPSVRVVRGKFFGITRPRGDSVTGKFEVYFHSSC
jgi:hypothetical protein